MEENNDKKLFSEKDKKLRHTAVFVWWRVCFAVSFLICFFIVDLRSPLLHRLPKLLLFSFLGSVLLVLLLFFIVFPLTNRTRKPYTALLKKIRNEGMTAECLQETEAMYEKCRQSSLDNDYSQQLGYILANHYTMTGDYEKAHNYIDALDMSICRDYINIPTYQARALKYHALRIILEAADGGSTFAETAYTQAKPYFEQYGGLSRENGFWAAIGTAEYLLSCGKPEEAAKMIEPYLEYTESKTDVFLTLAKAAKATGDTEKAKEYIDAAYEAAEFTYAKNVVDMVKKRLKT
ncbi:MAG: hypothetical protein J5501_08490 [Ruminococcus sp.]|nr:hypothetical protein [Ruminococcus sp.]